MLAQNSFDLTCRVAAYLTHQDGCKRFVTGDVDHSAVLLDRPRTKHIEIWESSERIDLVYGTGVEQCFLPTIARGIVFREGGLKWSRSSWAYEYNISETAVLDTVVSLDETVEAWHIATAKRVFLSAGMLLKLTGWFTVGGVTFVLAEDKDATEFIVLQLSAINEKMRGEG